MYKFIKTKDSGNEYDVKDVCVRVDYDDITLDELLDAFKAFLLACGFSFEITEHIGIIEEEETED